MTAAEGKATATTVESRRRVRVVAEISASIEAALRSHTANRRISRRTAIERALIAYLDPSREEIRDSATSASLRRMENRMRALVETNRVLVETVAAMVQLHLGTSPEPVTREERQLYNERVKRRWPRFVQLLTEVLEGRSQGLYSHIPKEMIATAADFPEPPPETMTKGEHKP